MQTKPLKRNCECGKRITHHHILCNKCWKIKNSFKPKVKKRKKKSTQEESE